MEAEKIVTQVVDGRKRFGQMYGLGEFSPNQILDALVELSEKGVLLRKEENDALTKVKRQLTAALAREGKLKKQIKELKEGK